MAAKTALITGASGFLGRQVIQAFTLAGFRTVGTGYTRASPPSILKVDLTDEAAVTALLDEVKPDVVVHCAANRYPDKCDQDPEGAARIVVEIITSRDSGPQPLTNKIAADLILIKNVQATNFLAQSCLRHSAVLIYISTDYVFPGTPGDAPYASTAAVRPTNLYGQSKLDGEIAVREAARSASSGHAVILRVPVLYGSAKAPEESAINILLDSVWKGQEVGAKIEMDHWAKRYVSEVHQTKTFTALSCFTSNILNRQTRRMSHGEFHSQLDEALSRNVKPVGATIVTNREREKAVLICPQTSICVDVYRIISTSGEPRPEGKTVTLQFTSEDCFTKFEICELFADILGFPLAGIIANTNGNDPQAKVQRPFDTHLSTQALRDLGIDVRTQNFRDFWRKEMGAYRK